MKRIVTAFVLTALSIGVASADTYRFGSQVVTTGDSEGRLRQIAGKPDRETPIETPRGGLEGYRLEYVDHGKSVQIEIVEGRIRSITQLQN